MQVGAFYYDWFLNRDRFSKTLRHYLQPQQTPLVKQNFEQHCKLAKGYGIDFLILNWEVKHAYKQNNLATFLQIAQKQQIKIALQFETQSFLVPNKKHRFELDKEGLIAPRTNYEMLLHETDMIKQFAEHEAWLTIENKPVLFFYVTRDMDFKYFEELWEKIRRNFFVAGDEVWWDKNPPIERLQCFDAIYPYNMYVNKGANKKKIFSHNGLTGNDWLDFVENKSWNKYKETIKDVDVQFFPSVLPGYNDRAVRHEADHYVIPRKEGLFFEQSLMSAQKYIQDGVVLITSFNEWYEDTQIEPIGPLEQWGEMTTESNKKFDLTCNCQYENYGFKYLNILLSWKKGVTINKSNNNEQNVQYNKMIDSKEVIKQLRMLVWDTELAHAETIQEAEQIASDLDLELPEGFEEFFELWLDGNLQLQ